MISVSSRPSARAVSPGAHVEHVDGRLPCLEPARRAANERTLEQMTETLSHTAALAGIGKPYRYTMTAGSQRLYITPTSRPLMPGETLASDRDIDSYIDRLVERGESREQILADLASRRRDVAEGYEDCVWAEIADARRGG